MVSGTLASLVLDQCIETQTKRSSYPPPPFVLLFRAAFLAYGAVPRLGVRSELQLLAYTIATASPDPSHVCNLQLTAILDP